MNHFPIGTPSPDRDQVRMRSRVHMAGLLSAALLFGAVSCQSGPAANLAELQARIRDTPAYHLRNYDFDPARSLESRVGIPPEHVLSYVRAMDERPDYRGYRPLPHELIVVRKALARLPPRLRRNLQERSVGIYFIENFLTSGMTDWVVDDSTGEIYSYMIFDASVLRRSAREIINRREQTCFISSAEKPPITIEVIAGGRETAMLYLLVHEAVHALDFSRRIGPYVEDVAYIYQQHVPRLAALAPLVDDVWEDYRQPLVEYDFAGRADVSFYGFRGGPKLSLEQAPQLYAGLTRSPFASLYGSQMWPEDLAELVSMYHLTNKLGHPYVIRVKRGAQLLGEFRPMASAPLQKRLKLLEYFY